MDYNLAFAGENVANDFTETLGEVSSVEHHSSRLMTMESYIIPWSDVDATKVWQDFEKKVLNHIKKQWLHAKHSVLHIKFFAHTLLVS